jgi:hypothetical protein
MTLTQKSGKKHFFIYFRIIALVFDANDLLDIWPTQLPTIKIRSDLLAFIFGLFAKR